MRWVYLTVFVARGGYVTMSVLGLSVRASES